MKLRSVATRVLPETALGWIDCLRYPDVHPSWGGPFNGQKFRQRIFFDIIHNFPRSAVVETGTYRGTTTALFAATSPPVYTTEAHPRFFAYSKLHFIFRRNTIHVYRSDSRSFLRELAADPSVPKADVFFYLDAHWGTDLPLREELEIIFSRWDRSIVMVDDFCVPDSSYSFDNYGPDKTLDLKYINPVASAKKLSVFFPAVDASEETGARRGCVVLCEAALGAVMSERIKTLGRYSPPDDRVVMQGGS